jgi:L-seryl-tRNA(Ser) seleniumtransferase
VVIHTNLGRAPLHPLALQRILEVSGHYSNLEYDLEKGERGSRPDHVEEILRRLTGGEAALIVNNNAGAVLLVLNTLAEGREVVVSRGELVEIGGAFRIPDVMRRSGAVLREVGTTNRTHLSDYRGAIGPQTALLLKVHPSNFRITGFTSEVTTRELVGLGKEAGLPVMEDLGSGCLLDLTKFGLDREPTVPETLKTGADVVTFSGDKLLGGPQAGIIVGGKTILEQIGKNPLARALRIDKLTLAALESTLHLYLDENKALSEIPVLRMLTRDGKDLRRKGRKLLRSLKGIEGIHPGLREDLSQVGGGSLPLQELPTTVVMIRPLSLTVNELEIRLRRNDPPILSRISREELILDVRTLFEDEIPLVALALRKALSTP